MQLDDLIFYTTSEHSCSYLPEKNAKTLFVDPEIALTAELYSSLSEIGFRRSGKHVYRPYCEHCNACIPIRIPVDKVTLSKSQKRVLKKNSDLIIDEIDDISSKEYYALYENYICSKHRDGDMYPPNLQQYHEFLTKEWNATHYLRIRTPDNKTIGISVIDELKNGPSAIYFFYDPEESHRSLGKFNILHLMARARSQHVPYLYLGYWIRECKKMNYKTEFQPFEILIGQSWIGVNHN